MSTLRFKFLPGLFIKNFTIFFFFFFFLANIAPDLGGQYYAGHAMKAVWSDLDTYTVCSGLLVRLFTVVSVLDLTRDGQCYRSL